MDPSIGRIAFQLGLTFLILGIFPLPFLNPDSPEFVIDVIAIIIVGAFLLIVVWDARRQARLKRKPAQP